jgi:CO dehydrogenase nickel-insertion accessory protein CooC1
MTEQKLAGVRIGIFGKGGAGKSTLTAMLAQVLHGQGYKVCVIDGDSTNFGLSHVLGLDPPQRSLLEYYGGTVFSGGQVTCPVDDPTPLLSAEMSLHELPADCFSGTDEGLILLAAGKIGRLGPGAGCDGPVAKIARDFNLINDNGKFLTLIDFKAGFEDSARGGLTRLDYVLVVIDPTTASIEIANDMLHMVQQIKEGALPATEHLENPDLVNIANKYYKNSAIKDVFFILNKIPDQKTQSLLLDKLSQKGIKPIASIPADQAIRAAWLNGNQIQVGQADQELRKIVRALE